MSKPIFIQILLAIAIFHASAQDKLLINTQGLPPITTYTGIDYNGFNQVWDIIQDNRGLIYVASTGHIVEFDGSEWRKIPMVNGGVPRCLTINESGRVYVAGIGLMGYLEPDALGRMGYVSLLHLLPEGTDVGRLEFVKTLNGKVHFAGSQCIIVYDETAKNLNYFNTQTRSYPNFILNEKMYFKVAGSGIQMYEDDTLRQAPFSGFFHDLALSDFISYGDSVLAVSVDHKFYHYASDTAYQKDYEVDPDLAKQHPYKLLNISDNYNVICYLKAGLVITDKNWKPIVHFDESSGVSTETYKAFLDRNKNLWLATSKGVNMIELASAYSRFDKNSGITGQVSDIQKIDQQLFVASTTGIFYKSIEENQSAVNGKNRMFSPVAGADIYNDQILAGQSTPLVRAYTTIGQIIDNKYDPLYTRSETQSQITFLKDSSYAITIGKDGPSMQLFHFNKDNWHHTRELTNNVLPGRISNLLYGPLIDKVWGANPTSLFSFSVSKDYKKIENFKSYSTEDGLPENSFFWTLYFDGKVIISTIDGVYLFDPGIGKFVKSDLFGGFFEQTGLAKIIQQDDSTFICSDFYYKTSIVRKSKTDKYEVMPLASTQVMPTSAFPARVVEGLGTFFGAIDEVDFIQAGKVETTGFLYPAMVRSVELITGQDSTIFQGIFVNRDSSHSVLQSENMLLRSNQNALRFSYSVPYYRHPEKRTYAYQLKGFDEGWSGWVEKTQKEYTNLPAGSYTFQVKAKNGFDEQSVIGEFSFEISSPWYMNWWAYVLYGLLFIGFVRLIVLFNAKRLVAENERLEKVIEERVKEIQEQRNIISKSLEEKESLLKEIHHRVKNNLQIIANLLYLQSGKFEDQNIKNILEEGQGRVRSMALIHQKLYENEDLKSIPFGEYVLELVNEIKVSFGDQAAHVQIKVDAQEAFFDVDSAVPLGLIINELTTNAFKYAFDGKDEGQFNIFLTRNEKEYELHISDNGRGIPEEIDIRKTRSLGLRLVRILSEQLEGKYSFNSSNGMSFKLKFAA